jgi:hypothetical protein
LSATLMPVPRVCTLMDKWKSCCICSLIGDSERLDDPWDDLEDAHPDYLVKLRAIDSLKRVPGATYLGNACIRHCTECGTLYFWNHGFEHFGDRDFLELQRFTAEQDRHLRPLVELEDEDLLSAAFSVAWDQDGEEMATGAARVFEQLLQWKHWKTGRVKLLTRLAFHARGAARAYAVNGLRGLARGDAGMTRNIMKTISAVDETGWPPEVRDLFAQLREMKRPSGRKHK